jgi:hypothetical protein
MTDNSGADSVIEGLKNARVEINDMVEGHDNQPIPGLQTAPPPEPRRDASGTAYNSAVHCYDASTGEPLLTKTGKFRKRAEGRAPSKSPPRAAPRHAAPKQGLNLDVTGPRDQDFDFAETMPPEPSAPQIDNEVMLAAETCAEMYIQTGVAFFGGEWLPQNDLSDRTALVRGFYGYLHHKGIKDIPPGIALAMAMFGYAAPRFHQPKTSAKIKAYWTLAKSKFGGIFSRATRHDIRSNGVRQNETGEAHSETGSKAWFGRSSS